MSAASPPQHATAQAANIARLLISLAIALTLHALLLFVVDWPRFTPRQASSIDLTLAGAASKQESVSRPRPATAQPTNETTAGTPVDQSQQRTAASAPVSSAPTGASIDEAAPAAPSPLRGQRIEDLVRAVANAAGGEPTAAAARVVRLHEQAPRRTDFAYYLRSWQRKVERIGQLNYPRQARAEGITGSLRLHVAIAADGALQDVRVLETSGHELLDQAALRIVRLAAPYAPFSPTMRETTDTLKIERTWRFLNSRFSS